MSCNCKVTEIVLGIVILIFALWPTKYSPWVIVIAAVLLILHALVCKSCGTCSPEMSQPATKIRKRK